MLHVREGRVKKLKNVNAEYMKDQSRLKFIKP